MQDPEGTAASEAQKHLTYYELDLGLNHVVRKWTDPVDNGANLLIPVPGGDSEGPGGVLVCAENFIIYKNEGHKDERAVIPKRSSLSQERGVLIVSYAMHKQKSLIFFFVQVDTVLQEASQRLSVAPCKAKIGFLLVMVSECAVMMFSYEDRSQNSRWMKFES